LSFLGREKRLQPQVRSSKLRGNDSPYQTGKTGKPSKRARDGLMEDEESERRGEKNQQISGGLNQNRYDTIRPDTRRGEAEK